MIRSPQYLERVDYERYGLVTPLTFPANGQHQEKHGIKFAMPDRDVVRDWFNVYFLVEYRFEALADGVNIANNAETGRRSTGPSR